MNAASYSNGVAPLQSIHESIAFRRGRIDQPINFIARSTFEELFGKREPVIITGYQTKQHYRLHIVL